MRLRTVMVELAVLAIFAFGGPGRAADADEEPKFPEVGAPIPGPFHALNLNGDRKGRYHCLVCRFGVHPTAALFVRLPTGPDSEGPLEPKGPLANLLGKIDTLVDKYPDANLNAFVVLMGDPNDQARVEGAANALVKAGGLKHAVFVWDGGKGEAKEGSQRVPDAYDIKEEPNLIVLLYNNYKVVRRQVFAEQPPTEAEIDALAAEFLKQAPPPFVNRKKKA